MGKEVGKITKIKNGWMTIQLQSGEQCNACASKSACFFAGPASKYRYIKIHSIPGYAEGNTISLGYRESSRIDRCCTGGVFPAIDFVAGRIFYGRCTTGRNKWRYFGNNSRISVFHSGYLFVEPLAFPFPFVFT